MPILCWLLILAGICTMNTWYPAAGAETLSKIYSQANPNYYLAETLSKIYSQANPNYYLAEKNGNLVMALANNSDPHQRWMINKGWGNVVKDEDGFPSIAFINNATGQVISRDRKNKKVVLAGCPKDGLHRESLWTQSQDVGHVYQSIRPVDNIHLSLEVQLGGDEDKGTLIHETRVILSKQNDWENQKWNISPIFDVPQGEAVRIYCEADADFFLTALDDFAVLALGNMSDVHQHWIKVVSWGDRVKDEADFPAFALVNKATLKALKHGDHEWDQIYLTDYTEITLEESILWTQSADVGNGYQCIRPVNNIHLNMDAKRADGKNGVVHDGNELILFNWKKQSNQKWKMVP